MYNLNKKYEGQPLSEMSGNERLKLMMETIVKNMHSMTDDELKEKLKEFSWVSDVNKEF